MKLLIPGLIMLFVGLYNLNSHPTKPTIKNTDGFEHQMMMAYVKIATHDTPKDVKISIPFAIMVLCGLSFITAGTADELKINEKA